MRVASFILSHSVAICDVVGQHNAVIGEDTQCEKERKV